MKYTVIKGTVAALALISSAALAQAQDWSPEGPVTVMIAFQAGGGADTMGRLLAQELADRNGWEMIPENVVGRGGAAMAEELADQPADGLAIGISVSEAMTYNLQAARNPSYSLDDFEYLSAITGSQMGIIARADRGWTTLADVAAAAQAGEEISFGAMSQKLADGAYIIGNALGIEFTTVMVNGGRGGLNGVVAEDIDIAWAAGVQTAGVRAGDVVNLVSAENEALRVSPDAPLLSDFDVPFTFGVNFMVIAPDGLPEEVSATYQAAIAEILNDPDSELVGMISRAFSGPMVVQGDDLRALIDAGYEEAGALLEASSE
jgi:tripartite-type tricarboxylate transporter receptor subunit TctC